MSEPISTLRNAPLVPTVPVSEFDWEANNMEMQYLTCPRHPNTKYLTKHVWQRTIHVISDPHHCDCLLSSLVVLVGE